MKLGWTAKKFMSGRSLGKDEPLAVVHLDAHGDTSIDFQGSEVSDASLFQNAACGGSWQMKSKRKASDSFVEFSQIYIIYITIFIITPASIKQPLSWGIKMGTKLSLIHI